MTNEQIYEKIFESADVILFPIADFKWIKLSKVKNKWIIDYDYDTGTESILEAFEKVQNKLENK